MHPASPLVLRTAAPWYTHRWPWLLMLGPAIVVVAGVVTGWLAYTRQDAMVVDDYYKRGKTINLDLRRDHVASALRLSVGMKYDAATRMLSGELTSFGKPVLAPFRIQLAHATQPEKDIVLAAFPDARGRFLVPLATLGQARWLVNVEGGKRDWRLTSEWRWPSQQALTIDADPAKSK